MHGRGRGKQETNSFSSILYCLALALVASCVDPYGLLACNLALCGRLWWAHSTLIDRSQLLWLVETGRPEQAGRPAGRRGRNRKNALHSARSCGPASS